MISKRVAAFIAFSLFIGFESLVYGCTDKLIANVCDFDEGVNLESSCRDYNDAVSLTNVRGLSAKCRNAIKADGDDCIFAYYRYLCSRRCINCNNNAPVCGDVCKDLGDECEGATAQGCFATDFKFCGDNESSCTAVDINEDAIKTRSDSGSDGGSNDNDNNQSNAASRPRHFLSTWLR